MPNADLRHELDHRMQQLTAVLGRTPTSVGELLETTFTGVSNGGKVTVTLDFRGTLRTVQIVDGTLIPGDEQALSAAVMEAHTNATSAMTKALTPTPPSTEPSTTTRGRHPRRRPIETENFEEERTILRK